MNRAHLIIEVHVTVFEVRARTNNEPLLNTCEKRSVLSSIFWVRVSCCLLPLVFRESTSKEKVMKRDDQLNHVHAFLLICLSANKMQPKPFFYIPFILIKAHRQPTDCEMLVVRLLICMQCLQCVRLFLIHSHTKKRREHSHLMSSAAWILCVN